MMEVLNAAQIHFFQEQGYLLIPNFAADALIKQMSQRAHQIIADFDMQQIRIFTTEDQNQHTDRYFLESGDKIRCFFEEEAFDEKGNLKVAKNLAINKIGHALHELEDVFQQYSYQEQIAQMAQELGMDRPSIVQSQYIFKQPHIGGTVHAHTDSTFIYTEPHSCLGMWLALEDARTDNGCLCVIPGSHRQYPLQQQFVRNEQQNGTIFIDSQEERVDWPLEQLIPLEVEKGTLVLLHGELVHASYANRSDRSRHAYIIHLIDLATKWSERNWLQRPAAMPFREMKRVISESKP